MSENSTELNKRLATAVEKMPAFPKSVQRILELSRDINCSPKDLVGLARLLSQKFKVADADANDCYLAGLLHDFGKVVFAQFMPQEFKQALTLSLEQSISLRDAEHQVIGTDHTVVGAMLVEKWQFPSGIATLILEHHITPENSEGVKVCLFVANQMSKQLGYAAPGYSHVESLPPVLVERFGGDLAEVIAKLGDISKLVDEAQVYALASKETT